MANSLQQMGGPAIAPPGANRQQATIPFRRATTGRTTGLQGSAYTNVGTPTNSFSVVLEGSGLMYGVDLDVQVTCAANAAAVAYFEDAPWSTITSCVLGGRGEAATPAVVVGATSSSMLGPIPRTYTTAGNAKRPS